jgi:hypothetical protein
VYKNCSECQNENKKPNLFTHHVLRPDVLSLQFSIFMNNLSSYCGLVNAKIRASDIDLPVPGMLYVYMYSEMN